MTETLYAQADAYAARVRSDYEAALAEIVEIPTVSTDPGYAEAVRRGAEWAMAFMRRHGVEAELFEQDDGLDSVGRRPGEELDHREVPPAERSAEKKRGSGEHKDDAAGINPANASEAW